MRDCLPDLLDADTWQVYRNATILGDEDKVATYEFWENFHNGDIMEKWDQYEWLFETSDEDMNDFNWDDMEDFGSDESDWESEKRTDGSEDSESGESDWESEERTDGSDDDTDDDEFNMGNFAAMAARMQEQAAEISENFMPAAGAAQQAWCKDDSCLEDLGYDEKEIR